MPLVRTRSQCRPCPLVSVDARRTRTPIYAQLDRGLRAAIARRAPPGRRDPAPDRPAARRRPAASTPTPSRASTPSSSAPACIEDPGAGGTGSFVTRDSPSTGATSGTSTSRQPPRVRRRASSADAAAAGLTPGELIAETEVQRPSPEGSMTACLDHLAIRSTAVQRPTRQRDRTSIAIADCSSPRAPSAGVAATRAAVQPGSPVPRRRRPCCSA